MSKRKVMEQALEALNKLTDAAGGFSVSGVYFNEGVWEQECLNAAYLEIKDRKGKMIDGVFVKEGDN